VVAQIEKAASTAYLNDLGATPAEALTGLLAGIEEQSLQSIAQDDPANWARQVLNRIRDWVGPDSPQDAHDWRKSKLNRALTQAGQKVAEEWDREITAKVLTLMEHAGARVAAAETALGRLQEFCQTVAQEQRQRLIQLAARTAQLWQQVE